MTKQSNDEKDTLLANLRAMNKRLGIKEVELPDDWARAIIPIPKDPPKKPAAEDQD